MAATATETGVPAEHGTFPPFDFTTYAPQLFWLAITFVILFVMLERFVLPRVGAVLKARARKIAGDLDAAERMRKDAQAALAAYEAALAGARTRAVAMLAEARGALKSEIDKRRAEVDAELGRQIAAAEAEIAGAHARALKSVRAVALEVAGDIVAKVLNERAPPAALAHAVDAELGETQAA